MLVYEGIWRYFNRRRTLARIWKKEKCPSKQGGSALPAVSSGKGGSRTKRRRRLRGPLQKTLQTIQPGKRPRSENGGKKDDHLNLFRSNPKVFKEVTRRSQRRGGKNCLKKQENFVNLYDISFRVLRKSRSGLRKEGPNRTAKKSS